MEKTISAVVTQQGCQSAPEFLTGKILFLTAFLFTLLCFQAFSANIVTSLTATHSLENLDELLDFSEMKIFSSRFAPFRSEMDQTKNARGKEVSRRINEDEALDDRDCAGEHHVRCDERVLDRIAFDNDSSVAFVAPTNYIYDPANFEFNRYREVSCHVHSFKVKRSHEKEVQFSFAALAEEE